MFLMRKPHYLRRYATSAVPSNILIVDTETFTGHDPDPAALPTRGENETDGEWRERIVKHLPSQHHRLRLGAALAFRLEGGKRTRVDTCRFISAGSFWSFLTRRLSPDRPLWVYGHNLAYDLGILGGWQWLRGTCDGVSKWICDGSTFHVEAHCGSAKVIFSDTFNFYHCSLAVIGQSLGFEKLPMPPQTASDQEWFVYCERDVEVTATALTNLINFVKVNELGPWQITIASQALTAFLSRFCGHQILVHANAEALALERSAYYGGLVSTPFIGRVPADAIWECDVQSMYPFVCTQSLPVKLVNVARSPSADMARRLMNKYLCIGEVEINTENYTYPCRDGDRVVYPTGCYRTALAHPELITAVANHHVTRFMKLACYESAPILRNYMNYFWDLKNAAGDHDPATKTLTKYFLNSLYGKFGQLTAKWQPWCPETFYEIALARKIDPDLLIAAAGPPPRLACRQQTASFPDFGLTLEIRDLFDQVEVIANRSESRDSCPAIAAHVTSSARVYLRLLQGVAGHGNWFYSDTDSLWVNATGLDRLTTAGNVKSGTLGKLKVTGPYSCLTVHGRKDYETESVIKIKGVRKSAIPLGVGWFAQLKFPGPARQITGEGIGGVDVEWVVKRLARSPDHCRLNSNGWTSPLVFPFDRKKS
jgi:DNA polymerase type B, organellar and viral